MDSGSIAISKFELDHFGNTLDLTEFVPEIHIFESIFDPFITARMSVEDTAGLLDRITWAGSKVTITFTTNEKLTPATYVFVVDSAEGATSSSLDKKQSYVVTMYSPEVIRALTISVGEMFNKVSPEKMIETVLRGKLNSNKAFIKDKTGALDSINCADLRPFQAIDKIKKRAVSRDKISSSFVFYENQHGYNFRTIEQLLVDARNDPQIKEGDRNFYLDSMKHLGVENTSWRQILALERTQAQAYTEMLMNGGAAAEIYAYDINTGEHYKFTYTDRKDSQSFDIDSKSVTYKRVSIDNIVKSGDQVVGMVAPVTSADDLERIRKEIYVKAFMSKLISNVVIMQIHGDSRMTAGTPVKLNLPVVDGTTSKQTNEIGGGVYLVSKVRHIIIPSTPLYTQSCELIRTGMLE